MGMALALRAGSIDVTILALWCVLNALDGVLQLGALLWSPVAALMRPSKRKKEVVIVGASFGGLAVQRELAGRDDLSITLVDFKDYFEYTPGVLRCFIDPSYLRHLSCALPKRWNALVTGEVTGVSATAVTIRQADGSSYEHSFDYLVLACGSTYQEVQTRPHTRRACRRRT